MMKIIIIVINKMKFKESTTQWEDVTSPSSPRPLSIPGGAVQPFFNWNPQVFTFIEKSKYFLSAYREQEIH